MPLIFFPIILIIIFLYFYKKNICLKGGSMLNYVFNTNKSNQNDLNNQKIIQQKLKQDRIKKNKIKNDAIKELKQTEKELKIKEQKEKLKKEQEKLKKEQEKKKRLEQIKMDELYRIKIREEEKRKLIEDELIRIKVRNEFRKNNQINQSNITQTNISTNTSTNTSNNTSTNTSNNTSTNTSNNTSTNTSNNTSINIKWKTKIKKIYVGPSKYNFKFINIPNGYKLFGYNIVGHKSKHPDTYTIKHKFGWPSAIIIRTDSTAGWGQKLSFLADKPIVNSSNINQIKNLEKNNFKIYGDTAIKYEIKSMKHDLEKEMQRKFSQYERELGHKILKQREILNDKIENLAKNAKTPQQKKEFDRKYNIIQENIKKENEHIQKQFLNYGLQLRKEHKNKVNNYKKYLKKMYKKQYEEKYN